MVSRATSLGGLLILRDFDHKLIAKRRSEELRAEFKATGIFEMNKFSLNIRSRAMSLVVGWNPTSSSGLLQCQDRSVDDLQLCERVIVAKRNPTIRLFVGIAPFACA